MNPWRRTRSELAGALRSVRYDLDRRPGTEPAGSDPALVEDVTSTGMSTFGVPVADELSSGYDPVYRRAPRRVAAVGAFGVLAVVGAAGSYFAVVNGLGSLLAEKPAGAEPYPLAAAAPGAAATAGMGRGSAHLPAAGTTGGTTAATTTAAPMVLVVPTTAPAQVQAQQRTPHNTVAPPPRTNAPAPSLPDCDCMTPPVPTPTVPNPTPSPTDSPSASPSATDTGSASPSELVDPADSPEGFVHSRRGRGY